ncbi:AAA family ATPase [bacterium]|nr:AAA family ATPase [bacterium]
MEISFAGRGEELHKLSSFYTIIINQIQHKANCILIEGDAGIGKSTLINYFAELVKKDTLSKPILGISSCELFSKEISFLPFFQILDNFRTQGGVLSKLNNLEKFNQTLGEIAPTWLKMLPFVGGALADTVETIRNLQENNYKKNLFLPSTQSDVDIYGQFLRIINNLAEQQPVIIIIDDLQWADEETSNLFTYLAKRLPEKNLRIMLVGMYRPYALEKEKEIFHDAILELRKRGQAKLIELHPFNSNDLSSLLRKLYGLSTEDTSSKFRQALISHTAGNPLFIIELLKYFEENNKIVPVGKKWKIESLDNLFDELPTSLDAALEQRIEHLERRLRDLLTIASVEGENFTAEVISRIKNIEMMEVLNALVEDLSKNYHLVQETGDIEISLDNFVSLYAFRHGLIRDYIYRRLSLTQKRLMHQQVGNCLENLYGKNKNLIAYQLANHFLISKDYTKTAQYSLTVARQEIKKNSPKQSLWWAKTAFDAIKHIGGENSSELADALLIMIQAYVHLGQNDDALFELNILEKNIVNITRIQAAHGNYLKGEVLTRKGDFENAILSLVIALETFKEHGEVQFSGWVLRRLGHIFAVTGDFKKANQHWNSALELLNTWDDNVSIEVKGTIWSEIAEFSVDAGDMKRADFANQSALQLFQQARNKRGEAITLRNLGGTEHLLGNFVKAEALTRRALEIFREIDDGINIIWSSDNLASILIDKRDVVEAKKKLLAIEPIAVQMNEVGFLPEIYIHLSEVFLFEEKIDKAVKYAFRATEIVADDDQYSKPRAHYTCAQALLKNNRIGDATHHMNIALNAVENTNYFYVKALTIFEYAKFKTVTGGNPALIKKMCTHAKKMLVKFNAQKDIEKIKQFEKALSSTVSHPAKQIT